ncbi:MAG: hypothetical protein RIS29_2609 [Bacteroidota bacterium]|jgi:hypothetical protein
MLFENLRLRILYLKNMDKKSLTEQLAIVSKHDELMHTCDELEASIRTSQLHNEMLLREVLREALEG